MRFRLLLAAALMAIAGTVSATPCLNTANGHYYEFIHSAGICWTLARDTAATLVYDGLRGHLATITSQDENAWIVANILPTGYGNMSAAWIGGAQSPDGAEPDGGWTWGVCTGEAWTYSNWDPLNIDNNVGCEEFTEMQLGNGTWGDAGLFVPGQDQTVGYVVEYDGLGPASCATVVDPCVGTCSSTPTPCKGSRGGLPRRYPDAAARPDVPVLRAGSSGQFVIERVLGQTGAVQLDVYDIQGRWVCNLIRAELPSGATTLRWDGRDASGAAVRPGVYLARLLSPQGSRVLQVIRLR